MKRIKIAVVGLGRTGLKNHLRALKQCDDLYEICAVADSLEERRVDVQEQFQCEGYENLDALLKKSAADWVVIATPQHFHREQVISALCAGKHVVCEKPMAMSLHEATEMVKVAENEQRHLTVFHNRRYAPDFTKVCEIINSGKLGRILMIKIAMNHFGRRWDWQTLKKYGGGLLSNYGPHVLDQALTLMGASCPGVIARSECAVTLGDADDHVKLILHKPNSPIVDIELSAADAFPAAPWKVYGTSGGLIAEGESVKWRYFKPCDLPKRMVIEAPSQERLYDSEVIPWQEEVWTPSEEEKRCTMSMRFYADLYRAVSKGLPPPITATHALSIVSLVEQAASQNI